MGALRGELPVTVFLTAAISATFAFVAGRRYEADLVVMETGTCWNYRMPDGKRARFTDRVVAIEGIEGDPVRAIARGEYPRS